MDLAAMIASLEAEYASIQAQLAADVASGAMPNDSFGGQSVDFVGFRKGLYDRQKAIREELAALQPFESHTQAW